MNITLSIWLNSDTVSNISINDVFGFLLGKNFELVSEKEIWVVLLKKGHITQSQLFTILFQSENRLFLLNILAFNSNKVKEFVQLLNENYLIWLFSNWNEIWDEEKKTNLRVFVFLFYLIKDK